MMGLLATKQAAQSTPFLIALPVLTIYFHRFCKGRYEPAFIRYPLEVCLVLPLQSFLYILDLIFLSHQCCGIHRDSDGTIYIPCPKSIVPTYVNYMRIHKYTTALPNQVTVSDCLISLMLFLLIPQEAMVKDTLERIQEPNLNLKSYLQNAYLHPVFKGEDDDEEEEVDGIEKWETGSELVPTKRFSQRNTPVPSKIGSSPPSQHGTNGTL